MVTPFSSFHKFLKSVFRSRLTIRLVVVLSFVLFLSLGIPIIFTILSMEVLTGPMGFNPVLAGNVVVQILGIVFMVLVFATFGVFLLVEPMVRPLRVIIEKVKNFSSKGQHTPPEFGVRSGDELEELAKALQEMIQRFQGAIQREQETSHMKSEFLGLAAHQLRTPLSAMKWALNTALSAEEYPVKGELRDLLGKSYASNERMITLVNSVLDVVQIEEGKFDYAFKRGHVTEVLLSVWRDVKILGQQKGLTMVLQKPFGSIPEISFDQEKLGMAIRNVLENAIQYTPAGGTVELSVERMPTTLEVKVQDSGIGIPKAELPRLFTKFFRGRNAIKVQTDGNGLGLYIAKNIVERHGGKIMVQSNEGKGSVFSISLPIPREFQQISGKTYQGFMKTF